MIPIITGKQTQLQVRKFKLLANCCVVAAVCCLENFHDSFSSCHFGKDPNSLQQHKLFLSKTHRMHESPGFGATTF